MSVPGPQRQSGGAARSPTAIASAGGRRCRGCWRSAFYFVFPRYLGFGTEMLITMLFAISLDLALGYAGIVTLGHAAFFGAGAYTVGMLAKNEIWTEPITGLSSPRRSPARSGFASGLVLLRTTGLTLLMLTLCTMGLLEESANMAADVTGGFDGLDSLPIKPMFGRVRVRRALFRARSISTCSACCWSASCSCARWSIRRSATA